LPHLPQARLRVALLAALLALAGCLSLAPRDPLADAVSAWVDEQRFSSWVNFYDRAGPAMPRHPDGFTLGNSEVFAAIGTDPRDLSGLALLWGQGHTVSRLNRDTPATLALVADGRDRPLRDFATQRARRVDDTGILVTEAEEAGVKVSVVDFAPSAPDLDALVRLVLVTNGSGGSLRNAAVRLDLQGRSEAETVRSTLATVDRGRLLVYGRLPLSVETQGAEPGSSMRSQRVSISQAIGSLGVDQRRLAIFVLAPLASADQQAATSRAVGDRLADPMACLRLTGEAWQTWYGSVVLHCSDQRLSELLDGLLELMRSHVGTEAIHTGSLRYPHNRIYLRDSYWVQRAFLEAGRPREAQRNLNFLWRMWQKNGLASYYSLPERTGAGYGYQRVELPHYLVLMVRDAERWAGLDPKPYWPMVKACLEQSAPDEGYQVMNGDETWLLAVPADELAYQLDNTWLLEASARYGAGLARRMGDAASAQRYQRISSQAASAAFGFMAQRACQKGGNYWDRLPISGVIARGAMLEPESGAYEGSGEEVTPEESRRRAVGPWLEGAWRDLRFDEGIRSSPRSTVFDGGTPGYVLYAASHLQLPFAGDLVRGIENLSAPMGNFWELHDSEDPEWGLEKRRLWDSAVVLSGLVHDLFGITPLADGVVVDPNPPAGGWVECKQFPLGGHRLGIWAAAAALRLTWDGQTILDAKQPLGAVIRGGKVVQTFPRAAPQSAGAPAKSGGSTSLTTGGSTSLTTGWPTEINSFLGHRTPEFIILHEHAPNHARRIAVEMLKQKQFVPPIAPLDRNLLARGGYGNAILIAKTIPPTGGRAYAVVHEGRLIRVWVRNTGDAWRDTDPLVEDLLRFSVPQGPRPLPFPDALFDLGRRLGVRPTERLRVQISASKPMAMACGAQAVQAATSLDTGCTLAEMQARPEGFNSPFALVGSTLRGNLSDLTVSAHSPAPASVTVTVTVPVTYWVVSGRGNSGWDRLADPVREYHDPDGSKRLVFVLHPGPGPARTVSLVVTKLPVRER